VYDWKIETVLVC